MGNCQMEQQVDANTQIESYANLDYNRHSTYQKLESIATGIVQSQKINNHYTSIIQRIIASRQEHILRILDKMDSDHKGHFIQQLESIDLEMVDSLNFHLRDRMDSFTNEVEIVRENPLQSITFKNNCALVLLCGGLDLEKMIQDIGLPSRKSVLQLIFERVKKLLSDSSEDTILLESIPICMLISDVNGMQIKQFMSSKKNFGFTVTYVYQKSLPIVNLQGQIEFKNYETVLTPNGTGNILTLISQFMFKNPTKYIHFLGCENALALPLDPRVLNLDADVICKCSDQLMFRDDRLYYHNSRFQPLEHPDDISITDTHDSYMLFNDIYVKTDFLIEMTKNHDKALTLAKRYHMIKRNDHIQFEKYIWDIIEVSDKTILYQIDEFVLQDDKTKTVTHMSNIFKKWSSIHQSKEEDILEISPNMAYCHLDGKPQQIDKYPALI